MELVAPHAQLAIAAPQDGTGVNSWNVSAQRGGESGVGISVSGAGAWARLTGQITFTYRHLESSQTFNKMQTEYNIGGGVSAFWSWLGISANASTHRDEIHQVFNELSASQAVEGVTNIDLEVSGQYPNVEVSASAYMLSLSIQDSSGNKFSVASTGDPASDTGAQDQNGNVLPQRNNNSTITV